MRQAHVARPSPLGRRREMTDFTQNMDTTIWLHPDKVFDGTRLLGNMAVGIWAGRVCAIIPRSDTQQNTRSVPGILCPGFIDLQVNGGGDVMLNTTPTPEGIAKICAAHRQFGTIGILPTVITDAPEIMHAAVLAVLAGWGKIPGLLGIHIEGPHLALARRGTHAARFVRVMDDATIALIATLRNADIPVMLTLAPEAVRDGDISRLAEAGAIVSLGHTDTDCDTARHALGQGASAFTHLFNAMSPMLSRAPGVVGAAINSHAYVGMICDGIHVADEMIGLAIRARPAPDLCFLVSDAMPTIGGVLDGFDLYGAKVHLKKGRLVNDEGGLAGAHITQAEGVHRLINVIGIAPDVALRMATSIPARLMGLTSRINLQGQAVEDLILLDESYAFKGFLGADL